MNETWARFFANVAPSMIGGYRGAKREGNQLATEALMRALQMRQMQQGQSNWERTFARRGKERAEDVKYRESQAQSTKDWRNYRKMIDQFKYVHDTVAAQAEEEKQRAHEEKLLNMRLSSGGGKGSGGPYAFNPMPDLEPSIINKALGTAQAMTLQDKVDLGDLSFTEAFEHALYLARKAKNPWYETGFDSRANIFSRGGTPTKKTPKSKADIDAMGPEELMEYLGSKY